MLPLESLNFCEVRHRNALMAAISFTHFRLRKLNLKFRWAANGGFEVILGKG